MTTKDFQDKLDPNLSLFYRNIYLILEEKFYSENYHSLCSILNNIEGNSLKDIYEKWLNELFQLGLLSWETTQEYKRLYENLENVIFL